MLFIGIDLAWSERNSTGVAVIGGNKKGARLLSAGIANSDSEIMEYVRNNAGKKDAFIAIDAPLIVPNMNGRRLAEKLVGEMFRKYDAGAHPANRKRLKSFTGKIRGEEISRLLLREGFLHSPYIRRFENKRKFFEVYPHPSMVVLFNLERILRYKAKPKRDYAFRWEEFIKYQKCMKSLENSQLPLVLPEKLTGNNVRKLKGKTLKEYEDTMDAVFCAYIAYCCWAKPGDAKVLGNMKKGYILTPCFRHS